MTPRILPALMFAAMPLAALAQQDDGIVYGTIEYGVLQPDETVGTVEYEGAEETIPYGTIEYGVLQPGETVGTVEYETLPPDTAVQDYGITLAPGERIIGVVAMPSDTQLSGTATPLATVPPVDIDRVTGLPRNTPGWSGDTGGPAGIGCFPQGVCAHLNR